MFFFALRREGTFTQYDRLGKGNDPDVKAPPLPAANRNQTLPTSLAHP
jgi:hypothetical protein